MERLTEIKERLNKATPGPWKADELGQYAFADDGMMIAELRGWGHLTGKFKLSDDKAIAVQTANAQLIAHAPEDIRYLLDELEAANKRAAEYEKAEAEGRILEKGFKRVILAGSKTLMIVYPEGKNVVLQKEEYGKLCVNEAAKAALKEREE